MQCIKNRAARHCHALLAALPQSRLRLDAVRFVVSADFLALR